MKQQGSKSFISIKSSRWFFFFFWLFRDAAHKMKNLGTRFEFVFNLIPTRKFVEVIVLLKDFCFLLHFFLFTNTICIFNLSSYSSLFAWLWCFRVRKVNFKKNLNLNLIFKVSQIIFSLNLYEICLYRNVPIS